MPNFMIYEVRFELGLDLNIVVENSIKCGLELSSILQRCNNYFCFREVALNILKPLSNY